jgi:hypothetical protein
MAIESMAAAKPLAPALDAAYAKVTWRLIPFLALLWIIAWIDRVNIGFAKLQMLDDLGGPHASPARHRNRQFPYYQ